MPAQDSPRGAPLPVAMVLAAGFGTRLRPLTHELPKPLVPLGDRSVLAHIAEQLARAGAPRMVVNRHHLSERFEQPGLGALPLPVSLSDEEHILGTAGGVRHAGALLGEGDVLVINGDILARLDYAVLAVAHRAHGAAATLAVVGGLAAGEGTVGLDAQGRVVRLRDGRYGEEQQGGWFVGVQVLGPQARAALPDSGCLVGDVYMELCRRGVPIRAEPLADGFTDIGTPGAYLAACLSWLRERGEARFVAPGATIDEQVSLQDAIVGQQARISGRGTLQRVVVWPGAHAVAPLSNAVVTQHHVVQL